MTRLQHLQQRLLQLVHDPAIKPLLLGTGIAHAPIGKRAASLLTGEDIRFIQATPDHLATGADRPNLGKSRPAPSWTPMLVDWRRAPLVTHPLQRAIARVPFVGMPIGLGAQSRAGEILGVLGSRYLDLVDEPEEAQTPPARWTDADALFRLGVSVWRDLPEQARLAGLGALWLPADSRVPDHSLADHTRIAAAAAFVGKTGPDPWMVALTIRGVQEFITESRSTRDLWTASMIFAELAWAAMRPIVEDRGPEAILYPDLRGNPFVDQWMFDTGIPGVPPDLKDARTYAAMLPNTFVALVEDPAVLTRCRDAVRERWHDLAGSVRDWLRQRVGPGGWQDIWRRQIEERSWPEVHVAASRWRKRMVGIGAAPAPRFLPGHRDPPPPPNRVMEERAAALRPWVAPEIWDHYEVAQRVYWATDSRSGSKFLSTERGFDYALVHAQLRVALESSKAVSAPVPRTEPGEKCTITGSDQALSSSTAAGMGAQRDAARKFWQHPQLDPEGEGAERLGGPATVKRFLTRAGDAAFHRRHAGSDPRTEREAPFPSTAAIAAQPFLVSLAERWPTDSALQAATRRVLQLVRKVGLPEATASPEAQPRLARHLGAHPELDRFLALEPGYLYASALDIYTRKGRVGIEELKGAVGDLRQAAAGSRLGTRIAVLRADGDSIGKLILGDPGVIRATWGDVLHPEVVERINNGWSADEPSIPWKGFLRGKRNMGPGVHAAISRALATFSHEIVGWVVEREFGGRLVYAGGDDLLALLPVADGIAAAARLQQLFSAPFLVDTSRSQPWVWRKGEGREASADGAWERQRYRVPDLRNGQVDFSAGWLEEGHTSSVGGDSGPALDPKSDVFAMLGRHATLSAGVVLAHYKTPLRLMLAESTRLLDEHAKRRPVEGDQSKARLAVSWMSRSGEKLAFVGRWTDDELGPPTIQRHLARLVARYQDGVLANRAPYLLRDALLRVYTGPDGPLVDGLLRTTCLGDERKLRDPVARANREEDLEAARYVFREGLAEAPRGAPRRPLWTQTAVAGLLLARHLASEDSSDG